jgi:hypothetical protein
VAFLIRIFKIRTAGSNGRKYGGANKEEEEETTYNIITITASSSVPSGGRNPL